MEKKKAQVWVETVIYTLIGISIIGILLAVARPRIDEIRDRLIIEQTIESFNQIHARVLEIQDAPGNQRTLGLKLSRGKIIVNSSANNIIWFMESSYEYSQVGSEVSLGSIDVKTELASPYTVSIILDYDNLYNITISDTENLLEIDESPTPYRLILNNKGGTPRNIEVRLGDVN